MKTDRLSRMDPLLYSKDRVFWLGAGFSHLITNGQAPLMRGFFDRLSREDYPALFEFVESLDGCVGDANVECVVRDLEERKRIPLSPQWAELASGCVNFARVSNELNDYCIDRLADLTFKGDDWAVRLFASIVPGSTVITTNYDCLADRLLSRLPNQRHGSLNPTCPHCKMCALLEDNCSCNATSPLPPSLWKGALLKLHGSIAWKSCHDNDCNVCGCLQPDHRCRPLRNRQCSCCGSTCKPVIVMPSERKEYSAFPEIRRMWDAAFQALLHARELVVVGFSFSETDYEVRRVCKAALAKNHSLRSVTVLDIAPETVAQNLDPLLPESIDFHAYQYTIPRDGSQPDWLRFTGGHTVAS